MSVFDRSDMKIWVTLGEDFVTAAELALRQAKKVRRRNRVSPTAPRRNPEEQQRFFRLGRIDHLPTQSPPSR